MFKKDLLDLEKGSRVGVSAQKSEFDLPDPLNSSFLEGLFDHDVLSKNMKKFDKLYQQILNDKDLDERYFMNQSVK